MLTTTRRTAAVALLSGLALAAGAEGASAQYFDLTSDHPGSTGKAHAYGNLNFSKDARTIKLNATVNDLCGPRNRDDGWRAKMTLTAYLENGKSFSVGYLDKGSCRGGGRAIVEAPRRGSVRFERIVLTVFETNPNAGIGSGAAGISSIARTELRP